MATYTVVRGDCLWTIAEKKLGSGLRWTELADLNGIPRNNPIIYVGQVLNLDVSGGGSPATVNTTSKPVIQYFGLLAGTEDTVFATWSWDKSNTDHYRVMWYYYVSGIWFVGNDSNTNDGSSDYKNSTYSAPENATQVKFKVIPISKTRTVNNTETYYWTASWSTEKIYSFSDNPPSKPDVPTIEIDGYKLTASLENIDSDINATQIQFQVVKNNSIVFTTGTATITTNYASFSCTVDAGGEYKVRCRSVRGNLYSDWTEYSSNASTIPAASSGITVCKAKSETSVYLEWSAVDNAESYDIEFTTKREYFDGSDQTNTITGVEFNHYEKTGLESGQEYFFRVRAVNNQGSSAWSEIKSIVIGKTPAAPTTWSSTTTGVTGDILTLYWVHNSEDGSTQTYAEIEIYIDGAKETHTIRSVDEEDDEKTMYFTIDTSEYVEGTKIQWRVRTAGVTKTYGDWSIQRSVDIYAPPTLILSMTDPEGTSIETLESFPFYISGIAGPNTQTPISYHLTISSNEIYETVDEIGNVKMVKAGEEIYSKNFDTSEQLLVELSAGNLDLENNIDYTVTCTVSMNSGLTAEASLKFTVSWIDVQYEPNAEIGFDKDTFTASIRPYCEDENGHLIEGIMLSVYRREFDGSFTELATGIDNTSHVFITDPHPSLDFARYRVVAITTETGAVSYYDVPGYPVGEKAILIQWDEAWSNFDTTNEDAMEQPVWSGSLLRLPYNIDISDDYKHDSSLVKYIGRKYPVAYYGTQLDENSTWNVVIVKDDKETLYGLRRLANWTGTAYVREPSGSGYWANVSVSFSQKHRELTIPVTLSITRVEGGM